jgi:uncharacterized membrane protein
MARTEDKNESNKLRTDRKVVHVNGRAREIETIYDLTGAILHRAITPLKLELHSKDVVQIIVGSTLLAIPVSFTEEVWRLGAELPSVNVAAISALSMIFTGIFVYYTFYRGHFRSQWYEFLKRSLAIYLISFIVVGAMLTLIDKASWSTDLPLALKRVALVAFPASMSAAVANMFS